MPSPTIKPTLKVVTAKTPKTTGPSWPHPSKTLEAALTKHSPVFPKSKERHSPQSSPEQPFLVHPLVALVPLSTISELPRLDLLESIPDPDPPTPIQSSEKARKGDPAAVKSYKTGTMDGKEVKQDQIQGTAVPSSILPFGPFAGAASIPLPQSPTPDNESKSTDHRQSFGSEGDEESPGQLGTNSDQPTSVATDESTGTSGERESTEPSGVASILPKWIADQLPRQDSSMTNARTSRAPSVFPGAYPESESIEDTPIPTPGPNVEEPHHVAEQSEPRLPKSADKGLRPRKSVSIAIPNADDESGAARVTKGSSTQPGRDERTTLADSSPEREDRRNNEDKLTPAKDEIAENKHSQEVDPESTRGENAITESEQSRGKDQDQKSLAPQTERDIFLKPSQSSNHRDRTPISRTSSIATSHKDTDKADTSTLHDQESVAPSDADNSSLLPLLSSSPGDARSSHFSEFLDDNNTAARGTISEKRPDMIQGMGIDIPPKADGRSSLSTISSSVGSGMAETADRWAPDDSGEGPSHARSSLPAPKILVKDVSEVEDLSHSPPPRAPTTTPVHEGSAPRRKATFAALGELPDHQEPTRLSMKKRKLYVRKARYAVLRQPILNATLGRQVGGQAKLALKKLANGELVVIEPPRNL
ncbi:MAG: hypothetical protein Q9184_001949 [Pyrenodesmia sp. 2 TL-2023]